jgi:hypothetical protein
METIGLDSSARMLSEKQTKLIRLLREKKAQRGLQDLYFFCKFILGYEDIQPEPHLDMCNFISSGWPKRFMLEPRGSFKSTIGTIGYSIWRILKNPNIRILINSQELKQSKLFLSEIKGHFEHNQELISLYGDYVGPKWNDDSIIVSKRTKHRKEPTIMTGGVETPKTGGHVDLLINDDLHDEHNTGTPEQIDKVIKFWKLQSAILEPDKDDPTANDIIPEEHINGTFWAIGDLYSHIIDLEKQRRKEGLGKEYVARIRSAHNKDGTLYFPTRLTENYLQTQKLKLGSALYSCQYENNPVSEDAIMFKKKWMKFYGKYPPKNLTISAILDPAISERDDTCDSSFTILGTDLDGYSFILAAYFLKDTTDKIVDMMFKVQDLHKPSIFGIETVAFQKSLKYWVWERMRQTGKVINIFELKTDTHITKDMRIKGIVPYFESGSWQWPGNGPHDLNGDTLRLWDQVTQYPMSKYIDGVDSLAYHPQIIIPPALKKEPVTTAKVGITFDEARKLERSRRLAGKRTIKGRPVIGQRRFESISFMQHERVA